MRNRSWMTYGTLVLAAAMGACSGGGAAPDGAPDGDPGLEEGAARGVVTSLSVAREDGKPLDRFMTHHPIRVSMTIEPTGPLATHRIHVGLVEKQAPSAPRSEARTCLLGVVEAEYGVEPGQAAEEVAVTRDLVVPADCLAGKSAEATFNLWVGIDAPGAAAAEGERDSLGTQFFNEARVDLSGQSRNDRCVGPDGQAGCVLDVKVTESEGYNVAVDQLAPASHVAVMPPSCAVDFAAPLAAMTGRIRLFGAEAHSGEAAGEEARNALASEDGQVHPIELRYSLCPRGEVGEDGQAACAEGTSYAPLYVGAPGSGQDLREAATVERLVNAEPHIFNHSVFVAPESAACGLINGAWSGHAAYNLRVCETTPGGEHRNGGDAGADDCTVEPIQLVVKEPARASNASEWQLYKSYSTSQGNSVVSVDASFGTDNHLDLNGATTHTWAHGGMGGWFSFDLFDVWADGAAYTPVIGSYADAGVEVFGQQLWHYHQDLSSLHLQASPQYGKQACAGYDYTILDLGLSIEACASGTVGLDATLDIQAKYGNNGPPFEAAWRIGDATAVVVPWASLQLNAHASADIGVTRGGISGNMNLLSVQLPATASLQWGLNNVTPPQLAVSAIVNLDLSISTLDGNIHAWVEQGHPDWCDLDCGLFDCGYPCWGWSTVYDDDLISWGGYAWNFNLYSAGGVMTIGEGAGPCPHDVCSMGETLDASCSTCTASVCAVDSYCCDVMWDGYCVLLAEEECGATCE